MATAVSPHANQKNKVIMPPTEAQPKIITINELETVFYDVMFGETSNDEAKLNDVEQAVVDDISVLLEHSENLASLVPPLPEQLLEITNALEDENTDFDRISQIIHKDVKLAGEVVKMANSPFFRRTSKPIESLTQAIPLLGINGITNIATTVLTQRVIEIKPIYFKLFGNLIWTHSLECAIACRALAGVNDPCLCYFLGLIHDVGKVVMFKCLVDSFSKACPNTKPGSKAFKQMKIDYSLWLSWRIAEEWGVPENMIAALKQQQQRADKKVGLGEVLFQSNLCSEIHMLIKADKISLEEGKLVLDQIGLSEDLLFSIYEEIDKAH